MSNIRATCAMSYSSEIPRRCNARKICIGLPFVNTKKKNLKIKGKINNHTVMKHVILCMSELRTCTLKTACTSYVALVYVCTHEQSLCITSVHAKIK